MGKKTPSDNMVVNGLPEAAGNGLLDRRMFLTSTGLLAGLSAGGAALAGIPGALAEEGAPLETPPWMKTPGGAFTNYGAPSKYEKEAIRWIVDNPETPGNGVSWTPLHELEGTITPNGLHFERHHNGVPQIDPEAHRFLIHGAVKRNLTFSIEDLLAYPMVSRTLFVECGGNSNAGWNPQPLQARVGHIHGLMSCSQWAGVPLSILLEEAGIDRANSKWLIAEGADAAAVSVSLPVEKAFKDAFIGLYQNGERIRPENGYPMRLIVPGWEGVLHVKWLRRLKAVADPVMSRDETSKYTEIQPDGRARQFTFVMEVKSVITKPSPGMKMRGPGLYEISGLAWSGRGKIARVEVSADGGQSWAPAALDGPVVETCFTRFRVPWRWDGSAATLISRAVDETGAVQPTRAELVAKRGQAGYFHYNGQASWQVSQNGAISHVYL